MSYTVRLVCLVALSNAIALSVAASCLNRPVVVPIENVTLSNGVQVRGISVGLGTPDENISLLVMAENNETYVYGQNGLCDKSFSTSACTTFRGGLYDQSKSTTSSTSRDRNASDARGARWIKDSLALESNLSISNFVFGIANTDPNGGYQSQAQLGLGRNSSLLNILKEAGRISSRAYSVFWGVSGGPKDQQTSGSLILGGFDQSLIGTGKENYTGTLNYQTGCSGGMLVTISDISLNWPNGTDTSLFGGSRSAAIQACITPGFAGLMTLPRAYWDTFYQASGGSYPNGTETRTFGINSYTMIFDPDGVYYGDLTISLQNSISVRIPNTQFVMPDPYIDLKTGQIQTNESVRNIAINPIQDVNKNDLSILGRLFFTAAYLSVNHDAGTFSLWQADAKKGEGLLKALDEKNGSNDRFCDANSTVIQGPSSSGSSSSPTSSPPTQSPDVQSRLSGRAIAGVVVGALCAVGIAAVAALLFLKRRQGKQLSEDKPIDGLAAKPPTPPYHSRPSVMTEMPAGNASHELPPMKMVTQQEPSELDGRLVDRRELVAI